MSIVPSLPVIFCTLQDQQISSSTHKHTHTQSSVHCPYIKQIDNLNPLQYTQKIKFLPFKLTQKSVYLNKSSKLLRWCHFWQVIFWWYEDSHRQILVIKLVSLVAKYMRVLTIWQLSKYWVVAFLTCYALMSTYWYCFMIRYYLSIACWNYFSIFRKNIYIYFFENVEV